MNEITFHPVTASDSQFLYYMLEHRPACVNISHEAMPTPEAHNDFVKSYPYKIWMIIEHNGIDIGNIYLSQRYEIGVHLLPEYWGKGIGKTAVKHIMEMYGDRQYFLNVSPGNVRGLRFVKKLGVKHIHNTYKLG